MVINVSKEFVFVPEFNGNKSEPEANRIIVKIKNPTVAIKSRIASRPEAVARTDIKGTIEGMEVRMKEDDDAIIREMLVSIDGLSYNTGGGDIAIKNAAMLFSAPVVFDPLRKEIVEECKRILSNSEIDEKNS